MEEEGVNQSRNNQDDEESQSEASVIESDGEGHDDVPDEVEDQTNTGAFGANNFSFGKSRPKMMAKRPRRAFGGFGGFGQEEDEEADQEILDTCDLGKAGEKISPFMVAIKRNWQGLSFLMLESGFDLSLAVLDCFKAGKLNYVYTLLLKKDDGSFYQMRNKLGQNIAHLFSLYSTTLNNTNPDLYVKIFKTILKKGISFKLLDNHDKSCLHYAAESGNI